MESVWEAESYPALQDYYLVCYFAFAFPVARFLLNCLFYQVGTLLLLLLQMGFSLSLSQALATMRVALRVQNNRTESHSLPLFWIAPVSHLHCSSTHFSFLFSECDHHNTRRFHRQACGNDDRQTKSLLLGFSCVCICVCFCV